MIQYVDDFTDEKHVITNLDANAWPLEIDGSKQTLDFRRYSEDSNLLAVVKGLTADSMTKYAPKSVIGHLYGLKPLALSTLVGFLEAQPETVHTVWDQLRALTLNITAYQGLKALLRFASERRMPRREPRRGRACAG